MELLVVIGIIILIAASVVTVVPGLRERTQVKATRAFINRLEIALEQYYDDNRAYPLGNIKNVKTALQPFDPVNPQPSAEAKKQYIEFNSSEVNSTTNNIVDYWGNPFVYTTPGAPNQNESSYDLYSYGPDGITDPLSPGNDANDINNWSR